MDIIAALSLEPPQAANTAFSSTAMCYMRPNPISPDLEMKSMASYLTNQAVNMLRGSPGEKKGMWDIELGQNTVVLSLLTSLLPH